MKMMIRPNDASVCRVGLGVYFVSTTTTNTNDATTTTTNSRDNYNINDAVVLVRGDAPYGSREYLLVPNRHVTLEHVQADKSLVMASLRAHRNVLFGAAATANFDLPLLVVGPPLVQTAVQDAGSNGEQVQALAALHGLSDWVQAQLLKKDDPAVSATLFADMTEEELKAITSIATGIPRPGHSVVGMGTYTAGERAWLHLAQAFATTTTCTECALYSSQGAQLVQMEHLAETLPAYLRSAGGTMARFFFL